MITDNKTNNSPMLCDYTVDHRANYSLGPSLLKDNDRLGYVSRYNIDFTIAIIGGCVFVVCEIKCIIIRGFALYFFFDP